MRTIAWITSKNEQFDIKDIEARKTKLNIEDLPEGLSGFKNDIGFIDRTVSNLLNYYTKNETYNREKINELVSARLLIKIVDKLPTSDISTSTIYFLKRKKEQGTTQYESDVYDEYIYVDGTWELIGNTYVDLTNYYTKSETESKIDEKVAIETQNRTLADNTLQNNIDIVQTNVDNVNNSLNSEIVTRQNKDLSHETKMTEIETNLNSETVRATNAENNLSDRCDSYDSHVANKSNPHNVTKVQVGLGNVTNVSTTSTITSGSSNNITSGAVYTALSNKVDKVDGRGLSEQNYTLAEKTKLAGLSNYNDTSLSNRVSATESAITKLNANSSTSGSIDYKIAKALEGVTSISFEIVSSLPTTGVAGKIYFVKGTGSEATNTYTEYVWLGSNFERIGESVVKIDLSDIYTKSQVNALVSVKNNKITIEENYNLVLTDEHTFTSIPAGENPTTGYTRKLSQVWNYIKGKISSVLGLTATSYGGKADTAGTADKTVNDITMTIPYVEESGQYVIPFGNIPEPTSTEVESPYNWDITGFFSIIRPTGHNGSHLWFGAGHGYSHDWKTYAYLDTVSFKGVETAIKAFQYEGKWWLGLNIIAPNQGYLSKMTITFSRGLPVMPTCILYNSKSGGIANEEIYNSLQDIPSSWWIPRTIYNPITSTQKITAPNITNLSNHTSDKSNPHSVTKAQVGLESVVNTGDSATPTSGGTTKFTTGGAYIELNKKQDKITITDDSSTALTDADTFSTIGNTGTNPTNLTKRPLSLLWTYIKGKISSVLGLTATDYSGKANTAGSADNAKKIAPAFTTKTITTVSTTTIKYIKLADCAWNQEGTMEVYLYGSNFEDTLIINYGGGNAISPMLCGYYTSNNNNVKSAIVQKGSTWDGNYSIWIKILQENHATVNVAVLRGSCTINISETTTAPTNVINWDIDRGYWGTFTGSLLKIPTSAPPDLVDGSIWLA